MPSALYAISNKSTAGVIALCSLEEQELPDPAAWNRLLATLVGPRLPISLSTNGGSFELPATELGCDLVRPPSQQELEAVLAEPYKYRVIVEPDEGAPVRPGDGKEKVLQRATSNAVQAIALMPGRDGLAQVRVTLASPPPEGAEVRLWFEGALAMRVPAPRGAAVSADLFFTLGNDVTINVGASYGVMVFMAGAPIEARSVRATDSWPSSVRREVGAAAWEAVVTTAATAAAAGAVAANAPNAPTTPTTSTTPTTATTPKAG